jgi:hypothetical protein
MTEEQVHLILKVNGMIGQVKKHEQMQRDLSLKSMIYSLLRNSDNLVSKCDLKTFLIAVLGFPHKDIIESTAPNHAYGGFAFSGLFKFRSESQVKKAQTDFKPLFTSRHQFYESYIKQRQQQRSTLETDSFMPEINTKS